MKMIVLKVSSNYKSLEIMDNTLPNKKQKISSDDSVDSASHCISLQPSTSGFKGDWRAKCKNTLEINKVALKKSILTDVTFLVGPECTKFSAHKLILALGSPVFEAMFYGPLAEKGDTVQIPDISVGGFDNLLKFLYTSSLDVQDPENAFETFIAADKYCVTHLKDKCEKYLCNSELSPSNVWRILDRALFFNSISVVKYCLEFLEVNIKEALKHHSCLEVTDKCVECVLQHDTLNISEKKLLYYVVMWANHKTAIDDTKSSQEQLIPLLKHIRFRIFKPADFSLFLEVEGAKNILSNEDALLILKHLCLPNTCSLPSWCCTKLNRNDPPKDLSKKKRKNDNCPGFVTFKGIDGFPTVTIVERQRNVTHT